jgi:hypothetical protein
LSVQSLTVTQRPIYFVAEGTGSKQFPW